MASDIPATGASQLQLDYMNLLIAQLQNQDPLNPMDNNQMTSQLAQLSQLSQLESANTKLDGMNQNFESILAGVQRSYAESLIGKTVSFYNANEEGQTEVVSGDVEKVAYNSDSNEYWLVIGEYAISTDAVMIVE